MSIYIGVACCLAFVGSLIYMIRASRRFRKDPDAFSLSGKASGEAGDKEDKTGNNYLMTNVI